MPPNPESRRRWLFRLLPPALIVAALAVAVLLFATAPHPHRRTPQQQARLVEVTKVSKGEYTPRIEAWGNVKPSRQVVVHPRVTGTVVSVSPDLQPGGRVKAGDTLLKLDPEDYRLTVQQRQADLEQARANLQLEQGNQVVAKKEFELEGGKVSKEEEQLMLRHPQLATARAKVDAAKAALESARLDLQRTDLKAPFDALITDAPLHVGAQATPTTDAATLVGIHEYWVELSVPVSQLPWLQLPRDGNSASPVTLYHEGTWGDRTREGRVLRLEGQLETKGRMARLLVAVPDPLALEKSDAGKPRLLLGSFLRAEIRGRPLKNAVALDRAWLRDNDHVWVMDNNDKLAIRKVTVLFRGNKRVFVGDGLNDGDRVVTSDIAVPANGMPLRVNDKGTPP